MLSLHVVLARKGPIHYLRSRWLQSARSLSSRGPPLPLSDEEAAAKAAQREKQFLLTMAGLERYKYLHGDYFIPRKFIVPSDEDWPIETWNMNLGDAMWKINNRFSYKDKGEELSRIGIQPLVENNISNYDRIVEALVHHLKLFGDMRVPKSFNVKTGNMDWPESTWGLKLGKITDNIRAGKTFIAKRKHLESIGFEYSDSDPVSKITDRHEGS
jgi:hypothetical protein